MTKHLGFFDIDMTIYRGYSSPDFLFYLADKKIISPSVKSEYKFYLRQYENGSEQYQESANKMQASFAKHAKGIKVNYLIDEAEKFIEKSNNIFPWVIDSFTLLRNFGFENYLVSAAAAPLVSAFANTLGAKAGLYSQWEVKNGVYTGKITFVPGLDEKKEFTKRTIESYKLIENIFGFGDSTADVDMLHLVKNGFVVNPHQKEMQELSKKHGWTIIKNKRTILNFLKKFEIN